MSGQESTSTVTAAVAKAYVREMLDLNPMWQSAEILRRRRELWGIEKPAGVSSAVPASAVDPVAEQRIKERARRCIEVVESQFYELPDEKLGQYLKFLQSDRLPEYNAKAIHLKRVARQRNDLLSIRRESDDPKFVFSLLNGLVAPAAQAAALREQYIESIIAEKRVKPAVNMVKSVVANYPSVYELERDWFDVLTDPKNTRHWSSRYSFGGKYKQFVGNGKVNLIAISVVILVAVLAAVVNPDNRKSKRSSSPQRTYRAPVVVAPSIPQTPSYSSTPSTTERMDEAMKSIRSPMPTMEEAMDKALSGRNAPSTAIPGGANPPFGSSPSLLGPDAMGGLYDPPTLSDPFSASQKMIERMQADTDRMLEEQRNIQRERMLRGTPRPGSYRRPEAMDEMLRPRINVPRPPTSGLDPGRYRRPSMTPRSPGSSVPRYPSPNYGSPGGAN